MDNKFPRMGHPHGHGVVLCETLPDDVKSVAIKANSLAEEASRKLDHTIADVEQTYIAEEDEGVNIVSFKFRNGEERVVRIKNGSHGVDGNLPEIEDAIARANEAATKAEAIEKMKEYFQKFVTDSIVYDSEDVALDFNDYDKSLFVSAKIDQTFGVEYQTRARNNIAAASYADVEIIKGQIAGLKDEHDALVGPFSSLSPESFRTELVDAGYAGAQYVALALSLLYGRVGLSTALTTTAQTTNAAINELVDAIPLIEDTNINMNTEVFF